MEKAGDVNQYTCKDCGEKITTVNADEGTTPMFIGCRASDECKGLMASEWYRVPQTLVPGFVWYTPDANELAELDGASRGHVKQGGLLLRQMAEGGEWPWNTARPKP